MIRYVVRVLGRVHWLECRLQCTPECSPHEFGCPGASSGHRSPFGIFAIKNEKDRIHLIHQALPILPSFFSTARSNESRENLEYDRCYFSFSLPPHPSPHPHNHLRHGYSCPQRPKSRVEVAARHVSSQVRGTAQRFLGIPSPEARRAPPRKSEVLPA